MSRLRVVYSDIDGTLVGPGGCFFRDSSRAPTLEPARALVELLAAGVALVLVSGRGLHQMTETAYLLGADGAIAELGALVAWSGTGAGGTGAGGAGGGWQLHRMPAAAGAAAPQLVTELLAAYPGRLELHEPWHLGHEVDVLLRGAVDPGQVHDWLRAHGHPHLRLRDNGLLPRLRSPGLPGLGGDTPVHVYHLLPQGVSKRAAVAFDLARRGVDPAGAVAIGDSLSDLGMAEEVGRFFLVRNGARHAEVAAAAATSARVSLTHAPLGAGWAEAVRAALG